MVGIVRILAAKMAFLVLGLMGVAMWPVDPVMARESPSRGSMDTAGAWTEVRTLRAEFKEAREVGEEAAVAGSYKTAVRHYRNMKELLASERAILEKLIGTVDDGREMVRVRREIDNNTARIAEVKEVLKILELAIGDVY